MCRERVTSGDTDRRSPKRRGRFVCVNIAFNRKLPAIKSAVIVHYLHRILTMRVNNTVIPYNL